MPRRGLTSEWSIELDESFGSRIVDGDLQLLSLGPPIRTIWIAVWSPPPDQSPAVIVDQIMRDVHPSPQRRFKEQGEDVNELRYASWYSEIDRCRKQWSLSAYTVRRGSYVQITLLSDQSSDLDWALDTWRSLRFRPGGDQEMTEH